MKKQNDMIFGLDRIGVYWAIRITALISLVMIVWLVAIPNLQQTLLAISILIKQTMASESSPEFKLILLFVSVWITCVFISIGIRLYDKIWQFTKEGNYILIKRNQKRKNVNKRKPNRRTNRKR